MSSADAVLLDGRDRIAAACDRERRTARDRLRDHARAFAELVELEDADRAVPDDRACALQRGSQTLRRVRPDVEDHVVGADLRDAVDVGFGGRREFLGDDDVGRQRNLRHRRCAIARADSSRIPTMSASYSDLPIG